MPKKKKRGKKKNLQFIHLVNSWPETQCQCFPIPNPVGFLQPQTLQRFKGDCYYRDNKRIQFLCNSFPQFLVKFKQRNTKNMGAKIIPPSFHLNK